MSWLGSVAVRPGRMTFSGRLGPSHEHVHATSLLMVATSGRIVLGDEQHQRRTAPAAVVPVGARHSVHGLLSGCLMVYLEPEGVASRRLNDRVTACGDPSSVETWVSAAQPLWTLGAQWHRDDPDAAADHALRELLGPSTTLEGAERHPVLERALSVLPEMLPAPVRLPDLASRVALSPGRLGRLFADELGLSFPVYVRWLRMRMAIERVRIGDSLTDAAHLSGFADSAHLNRVFNEMFGMSPRMIARRVVWR